MPTRSGFAALIGRPNVGKSTLLNALAGEKLAIVSPKPQTTRTRILGVVTKETGQVAFVDTPGVHQAKGALNAYMVDVALNSASECDVVLFLVEADGLEEGKAPEIGPGNRFVVFLQGCNFDCVACHNPQTIPGHAVEGDHPPRRIEDAP